MKNPVNVLPMVQENHYGFNQVLSKMSWATKLKFSSTILQQSSYFTRLAKMKINKSAI